MLQERNDRKQRVMSKTSSRLQRRIVSALGQHRLYAQIPHQPLHRPLRRTILDLALFALFQSDGRGPVHQSELSVGPDGSRLGFGGSERSTDTGSSADGFPVLDPLQAELVEYGFDRADEVVHLFDRVPRGRGDPEPLFADLDGRVVDALHVDAVFAQERVRGFFG